MDRYVVIHYGEIALKGKNRHFFEQRLQDNVAARVAGLDTGRVKWRHGRFLVPLHKGTDEQRVVERLRTVPGIVYFALARAVPCDVEALASAVVEHLPTGDYPSFKIDTRRADKAFPLTSPQVNEIVGAQVQEATGWAVDLSNPALTVHVEILAREILFYSERIEGIGGLPVGVSGTVGLLMSGGIDSPVAAYYALKRGCTTLPIHFHSGPFGQWIDSERKVRRLVQALQPYGLSDRYYVVPIGELQREIVVDAPAPVRILLYRRLMFRIAQVLTLREGGLALVTGENLGQVSSQTLESLRAIEIVTDLPVLRPLIGFDKVEIMDQARLIGTYDISIEAHDDCCQFLVPRQVVTRPSVAEVDNAEANLDIEHLVSAGIESAQLNRIT
ncbi:MAG TPA: tRNA uracil 4-sulfurtransferase ThiI [Anaerolineae bacterium]|nr:tRNA uracil 4-sulfurtransferase ThiI [Anaerolineae bacterium]